MANPYFLPNDDKNCRLEELPNGLRVVYILSCPETYPKRTFKSKNKWYVKRYIDILYTNNMSNVIFQAYLHLKRDTMLELALYKKQLIEQKIIQLALQF